MLRSFVKCATLVGCTLLSGCVATEKFLSRDTISPINGAPYREEISGVLQLPKDAAQSVPVVIVLESCGGDTPSLRRWMNKINEWGYAAFLVRSIESRGAKYCSWKRSFYTTEVASDAYGAVDYLKENTAIDNKKIGLLGFSLGAGAINQVLMPDPSPANGSLVGVVSFYYQCEREMKGLDSVPMLQITASRDVRHHPSCFNYEKTYGSHPNLKVVTYNAYHAFDDTKHMRMSKDVGGNEQLFDSFARDASEIEVMRFFDSVFR